MDVGTEIGGGEHLDGAGQVGEGDSLVHHQASIWWNTGRWRASGVSVDSTARASLREMGRPPLMTASSMRWIWTGEVCVRSSVVSGGPRLR